ncbi:HNH endonuclease [Pacificispira sp.]|uniref:HNH endonuclease n=1 Tax=Pacificispira sp. TaxID=2888761 RepID=UPI003BA905EA
MPHPDLIRPKHGNILDGNTPTLDHIIRRRFGGTWHIDNLRLTHHYCNARRN